MADQEFRIKKGLRVQDALVINDQGNIAHADRLPEIPISKIANLQQSLSSIEQSVTAISNTAATASSGLEAKANATHTHAISDVTGLQTALNAKVDEVEGKGLSTEDYTSTEKSKLAGIEAGAEVNTVDSVAGKTGAVVLAKADVGLGNVDNTSDLNKPISTATQTALDLKAPLASPSLSGVPTAPTANAGTNTTQLATTAFVQTAVSGLVGSAPETLDTLNELAAALGDDPNFATTVSNQIGAKLDASAYTASDILTKIKTVDGASSGLDADLLDGQHANAFAAASHSHAISDVTGLQTALDGKAPLTGTGASGTWGISITGNAGTVSSITSSQVTTALGYTPYNSTNPSGYINSSYSGFMLRSSNSLTNPNTQFDSSAYRFDPNANNPTNDYYAILTYGNNGNVTGQLATHFQSGETFTRAYNSSWSAWRTQLDSSNYNSYSPTLTGGGASGTWGISITGNAGTATTATTANNATNLGGNAASYYDHRAYTSASNYLGGHYTSGGTEKPNSSTFGAGKLKLAMLGSGNLGFGGTWNDVLWLSGYTGGDVKGSYAIVCNKYNDDIWFSRQNFDSASWGTGRRLLHSGNHTEFSPTLTGTGASGTWGISITGNAGTVTNGVYTTGNQTITGLKIFENATPSTGTDAKHLELLSPQGAATDEVSLMFHQSGRWYHQIRSSGNGFQFTQGNNSNRVPITASEIYGTIFYDTNNTAYYVDPNATSALYNLTLIGAKQTYLHINPGNGYEAMVQYSGGSGSPWYVGKRTASQLVGTESFHFYSTAASRTVAGIDTAGNIFSDGSVRSPIFYDSNNTAHYVDPASTSNIVNLKVDNVYDSTVTRFTNPSGGSFTTQSASVTGAIRIRLPAGRRNSSSMLRFTVKVYEYTTGRSHEFQIGGYNYNLGSWYNWFATQLTDEGRGALNVRFGDDGSRDVIYIGEAGTVWSYPQVFVTDVQVGFGGISEQWGNDWIVDFTTSLTGVEQIRTASLIKTVNNAYNWGYADYATIFYDSNDTGYYVDPNSLSRCSAIAVENRVHITENRFLYMGGAATSETSWGSRDWTSGGHRYYNARSHTFNNDGYGSSYSFIVNASGNVTASVDMRAPIFYDSNNTAYYVDPASTSNTNAMRASEYRGNANVGGTGEAIWCPAGIYSGSTQWFYGTMYRNGSATHHSGGDLYSVNRIVCDHNYGEGLFGVYSSTRYQHVWSMGEAYKLASNGTSVGNLYGLSWTHPNVGTGTDQAIAGLSHQLQLRENGSLKCAFGAGIWTSGNVTAYSDIAVKTNLQKIPNALTKVMQINGYTYDRTDFSPDPITGIMPEIRQAGVVAQEVEKILPEVVSGSEGNKAVAYGNMVALLIEAIKEQQTQIEALTSEINTLKEMIK